jgi:hypothetical protein
MLAEAETLAVTVQYRLITVDLLLMTNLNKLNFLLEILFAFITKTAIEFR